MTYRHFHGTLSMCLSLTPRDTIAVRVRDRRPDQPYICLQIADEIAIILPSADAARALAEELTAAAAQVAATLVPA